MGHEILKKFGRYFLLDAIAQGGMAEIYRACLAEKGGHGRLLVIKRIPAGVDKSEEFLSMFRSEIKVTMGFNHPNIVQLYDYGEEAGNPFIAMELIDGKNLRQILMRFIERKVPFPIEFAVYCAEQTAGGLAYAHSFKDKITGESLNLVHRDVSPQNILVSFDGNVKIIDFGIVKSAGNTEATRAGVIKGKLSYLSPEQITGEELDGRSDVFALGIVLWELLTGRKLFHAQGGNEFAILKLIESCQNHVKRPSTINPQVPKELDFIVLKALAKDRGQRYQSAEDFQRALRKFLVQYAPDFNTADFAPTIKSVFQQEIVEDRKTLQKLSSQVERLLSEDTEVSFTRAAAFDSPAAGKESVSDSTSFFGRHDHPSNNTSTGIDLDKKAYQSAKTLEVLDTPGVRIKRKGTSTGIGLAQRSGSYTRSGIQTRQESSLAGLGAVFGKLLAFGVAALIALAYFGPLVGVQVPYLSKWFKKPANFDPPTKLMETPTPLDSNPVVETPGETQLFVNITPPIQFNETNVSVSLNGTSIDLKTLRVKVPFHKQLDLSIEREKYFPVKKTITVSPENVAGQSEFVVDIAMEGVRYGFLTLHTTPSAEAIIRPLDATGRTLASGGKAYSLRTPLENERIPAGNYSILLKNDTLGVQKTITISVQEGKVVKLNEAFEIKD